MEELVHFYSQQYFSDMNYSKTMIAVICEVSSLIEAISSKYAYKFEALLNLSGTLISVSLINVFSLMGLDFIKNLSVIFFSFDVNNRRVGFHNI